MALIERMRGFLLGLAAAVGTVPSGAAELNDYPTAARVDYVLPSPAPLGTGSNTGRDLYDAVMAAKR